MSVILWGFTACAAQDAPELIGSYPSIPAGNQTRSNTSKPVELVYEAEINLHVGDVYRTSEKIARLASQYGGYLVDSQTWFLGEEDHAQLTIKVPSCNFFPLYNAIKKLGEVEFETYIGEPQYDYSKGIDMDEMSEITIHLSATLSWYNTKPVKGWYPLSTFQNALAVSTSIITFIIDVLIWLLVVLCPFVLIFLGIKRILQHFRPLKPKDTK
jgi:hypothetical protein